MSEIVKIAIQAALKAGEILRKSFMAPCQISVKSGFHNLVTEFDKAAELAIINEIKLHYPDHSFLAEESGGSPNHDSVLWIIDPLDGTLNFVHHIPLFSVSIAAYFEQDLQVGVIYIPMVNELFVAVKGKGATLNGCKISVSQTQTLANALHGTGFPSGSEDDVLDHLDPLINIVELGAPFRDLGSAAINLAYVAAGRLDTFWIPQLQPWDMAAGILLVEEAGGIATRYDGATPDIFSESSLVATNGILHQEMKDQFRVELF